ncbi:sensor histidine kinase [Nonomuraea africana]|uniref:histidine kinase n=1 Tax=Nonomuraea africana TaxID=46171 RepID=A0ABR9K5Z9_9ACTN|nr:histidine kinase [Nonomuraea africana]MBE1557436.1 signal transduction histidine kinase [Nonomuraea africana]
MSESRWHVSPLMLQLIDVAVAVTLFFVALDGLMDAQAQNYLRSPQPYLGWHPQDNGLLSLAAAATTLPVILRRRWPLPAWALTTLGQVYSMGPVLHIQDSGLTIGGLAAYLLCLYTVSARHGWTVSIVVGAASTVWAAAHADADIVLPLLVPAVVAVGRFAQARRRTLARLETQAEQALAAQAVAEERLRIARELHDVVAHHMSAIAIQAEAVRIQADGDAVLLAAGLADVRAVSLEALSDMRQIVGALREAAPPGLERLAELVESARAAGLTVEVSGPPDGIAAETGAAAYRIVQEALSNAMRHAPGSAVSVKVRRTDAALLVHVANRPPARPPTSGGEGGHGLKGMRERVTLLGGTLEAGPTPEGGFAVTASLPDRRTP